jgi:hypothetical protein
MKYILYSQGDQELMFLILHTYNLISKGQEKLKDFDTKR